MEEEATNEMGPPSQLPSQPPNVEEVYGVEEPYKMDEANQMEEDATQPSTQLMIDPRRLGEYDSDLSDEDAGDILCIFHPASLSAIQVAANITEAAPEHTVSRAEMPLRIKGLDAGQEIISPDTMVLAEQGLVTRDLALRLSAKLKDPLAGFVFGRNVERCDFVLTHAGKDGAKRISNIHFRVWVTENGVIMLEDQSTNGTVVEGKLLRSKSKEPGHTAKHTLTHGTLIKIHMISGQNDDIQFVVRIPKREEAADELWTKNMHKYFERLDNARARRTLERARAAQNGNANGGAPDLFADQNNGMIVASRSIVSSRSKEWTGGRKYNKQYVIGKGAFATVYLLTDKYTGDQFAAKEIEKRKFMKNGVIDAKIDQEMKIMEDIQHENIVKFIECVDWSDHLYLIMEFAPEGTLSGLIDEIGPLAEDDTKAVASQMLSALAYLHERGIAHRDIKPDNVLVRTKPPHIHVQLTDFGLSKKVLDGDDTFLRTFCGTILYCAPEVYPEYLDYFHNQPAGVRERAKHDKHAKRYDHMVDVWSLAGLLFFCLTKLPPYSADHFSHHSDMLRKIMTGALDVRPLQKMDVTELGISFLKSMLNNMPQLRATIAELLEHRWLTGAESFVEESIEEEETEIEIVNGRQVYRGLTGESFHLDTQMTDVGDFEESDGPDDTNDDGGDENLQDVEAVEHEDVGDMENVNPLAESGLEQSASQLSIVEAAGSDFEDEPSEPSDEVDFVDLINFAHDNIGYSTNRASYLRREIPDSIGSDSFVSFDEQFAPQQTTPTAPRLFGEVKSKAVALDFPLNELAQVRTPILANVKNYNWNANIPTLKHDQNRLAMSENQNNDVIDPSSISLPDSRSVSTATTNQEAGSESDDYTGAVARQLTGEFADANTGQHIMEHTTEHAGEFASADSSLIANSSTAVQASGSFGSSNTFAGAGRAPSLLGAESMVGDMAINSPRPTYSADASSDNSNINTANNSMMPAASLRRPREADEDGNEEDGRPAAKRHHSITLDRLVNGPKAPEPDNIEEEVVKKNKGPLVPASLFFDARNKLTHHLNYPTLSVKEYEGAVNLAKAQGEDFMHGGKLFNMVIKTYQQGNGSRRSSTSSMDSWDGRAQSEPIEGNEAIVAQGHRGMSESRDQLPFGGKYGGWVNGVPTPEIAKFFPKFANYYDDDGSVRSQQMGTSSQMAHFDGFQPPKRILAKLISTPDSVIQGLTITITETLTTWGRGFKNTIRYEVNDEDRVPKNALKLILWASGMKPGDPIPVNKDNEHAFYIATKATHGIKVNNVPVAANEPAEPQKVPANYWGRLQHGDIIVAWSHALQTKSVVKFRFDCFWGASAKPRQAGDFFDVVEAGPVRDALNRFCQWEESRVMKIKFEADMREKAIRDAERGAGREGEGSGMTPSRGASAASSHTDDGGRMRGLKEPGSGLSFSQ